MLGWSRCRYLYCEDGGNGRNFVTVYVRSWMGFFSGPEPLNRERKCAENHNKWHNNFFLNCNQHFANFKIITVSWCCLTKLLLYIFVQKYIQLLALEMASPGNQHCANCIGTLSFPISSHVYKWIRHRFEKVCQQTSVSPTWRRQFRYRILKSTYSFEASAPCDYSSRNKFS